MTNTSELAKQIQAEAKGLWNDREAIMAFAETHHVQLTLGGGIDGIRVGVLNMVAEVRLQGRYEWDVMTPICADPVLFIRRETPPESLHERNLEALRGPYRALYDDHF